MGKFCENCGAGIEEGAFFCPSCGVKIEADTSTCDDALSPLEKVEGEIVSEPRFNSNSGNSETSFDNFVDEEPVPTMGEMPRPEFEGQRENDNNQNSYNNSYYSQSEEPAGSYALAIISMVMGIISLLCCCWFGAFGIMFSLASVVIGIISLALKKAGKGMAIAGIVCGSIALLLSIFMTLFYAAFSGNSSYTRIYGNNFDEIIEEMMDEINEYL